MNIAYHTQEIVLLLNPIRKSPMKKLPLIALSLALAFAGLPAARADTIHSGSYTVDITKTGGMAAATSFNTFYFGHESRSSTQDTVSTGAMNAQFTADAGLIFDRVYFNGMAGGAIFNGIGARAIFDWNLTGGTFVGGALQGGPNDGRGFVRQWTISASGTGQSVFYDGYWDQTVFYDFNNPVYGAGYYSIGSSSFSMDIDALVQTWGSSGIIPQSVGFSFTYRDAPPPSNSVPETGATAGLMLLGLAGMAGLRRIPR